MSQLPKGRKGELTRLRTLASTLSRIPSWIAVERTLEVLRHDFAIEAISNDVSDILFAVAPTSRKQVVDKLAFVDSPNEMSRFIDFVCDGNVRKRPFPPSAIPATEYLTPLDSPSALRSEALATGVSYNSFWIESVFEGVAYFYAWRGSPPCTILVVYSGDLVTRIEVRGARDEELDPKLSAPIVAYVRDQFYSAGFSSSG